MPWFRRLSNTAAGFDQGNLPVYPASHGCLRRPRNAAKFLFENCPLGTLVAIKRSP